MRVFLGLAFGFMLGGYSKRQTKKHTFFYHRFDLGCRLLLEADRLGPVAHSCNRPECIFASLHARAHVEARSSC